MDDHYGKTTLTEMLIASALKLGATNIGMFDPRSIELLQEVRDMCAANRCGRYGKSWTCPPAIESLDHWRNQIAQFDMGIIIQLTVKMEDEFDYEAMCLGEAELKRIFRSLKRTFPSGHHHLLYLESGTCTICDVCTYPEQPCRYPDLAIPSLEAVGIVVTDLCQSATLPYYYGPLTLTYSGAVMLHSTANIDNRVQK